MTEPEIIIAYPPPTPRRPWWLFAIALVVAAGIGFGAAALIWAGDEEPAPASAPESIGMLTPEQYDKCIRDVTVFFNGPNPDPAMREAENRLRQDPRFESVSTRTRAEAYEHFKRIFAEQPKLLELTRPDSLPASVNLTVRKGTTGQQVEGALRTEFPDADVQSQDYCGR